jgi:hypothetical protein
MIDATGRSRPSFTLLAASTPFLAQFSAWRLLSGMFHLFGDMVIEQPSAAA